MGIDDWLFLILGIVGLIALVLNGYKLNDMNAYLFSIDKQLNEMREEQRKQTKILEATYEQNRRTVGL